jgi:hypothetical protein
MPEAVDLLRNEVGDDFSLRIFRGKFNESPPSLGDLVTVILDAWEPDQPWGPMPWQAREDLLPVKGDTCWVAFDDDDNPVVIAWWPYEDT